MYLLILQLHCQTTWQNTNCKVERNRTITTVLEYNPVPSAGFNTQPFLASKANDTRLQQGHCAIRVLGTGIGLGHIWGYSGCQNTVFILRNQTQKAFAWVTEPCALKMWAVSAAGRPEWSQMGFSEQQFSGRNKHLSRLSVQRTHLPLSSEYQSTF